jgi:23S rRNA (cytosine1962-C5)-methyltransferase
VFADALRERPAAPRGSLARLHGTNGRPLAWGIYDPESPLAFRCLVPETERPDDVWVGGRLDRALALRTATGVATADTTGYRAVHGEGDGLPGVVCDRYGDTAVIRLDGPAIAAFWDVPALAEQLARGLGVTRVVERERGRGESKCRLILGEPHAGPLPFVERGMRFESDPIHGHKTGFYLDQRDNRQRVRALARGRRVLNGCAYTGGFSVAAGLGGAAQVTSLDSAGPALVVADRHWRANGLDPSRHQTVESDVFAFLDAAKERWDLVVLDPPSFAPSQRALPQALGAYERLYAGGARVTTPGGLLVLCSCSSHVGREAFLEVVERAVAKAHRRATLLELTGQPPDHPAPLVAPELCYLKCVFLALE